MLNRASCRLDAALASIKEVVPGCSVSLVEFDLMSFDSVRKAGAQLRGELANGLDVLCNNAGVMAVEDEATVDGCDTQMQTNHLSHFLLTAEVWTLLEKTASLRGEGTLPELAVQQIISCDKSDGGWQGKDANIASTNAAIENATACSLYRTCRDCNSWLWFSPCGAHRLQMMTLVASCE